MSLIDIMTTKERNYTNPFILIIIFAGVFVIYNCTFQSAGFDAQYEVQRDMKYTALMDAMAELNQQHEEDQAQIELFRKKFNELAERMNVSDRIELEKKPPRGHIGDLLKSDCPMLDEPVDVVFTWVNGSDPDFQQQLQATIDNNTEAKTHKDDLKPQRFEDFNQLIYAIRSIEMYAPWVRHIFIVTNGQIPLWLKLSNTHVTIVNHKDIFAKTSHLPTFNSMAIEVHLHQIAGLSEKFIYFNDDVSFTRPVCVSDFWTAESGYKVFLKGSIGDRVKQLKCPEDCVSVKMMDGNCDQECNTLACNWDGDDCDGVTPPKGEPDKRPAFYQAIDFVNVLYERTLLEDKRYWMPHIPYMFNKRIMTEMQAKYEVEFEVTSKHKKRQKNDMQTEFSYVHWLMEAPKSTKVQVDKNLYKFEVVRDNGFIGYISYWNDMKKNTPQLQRIESMAKKGLKFLCINDLMDHEKPEARVAKRALEKFYLKLYPRKSSFEK